MCTDVCIYLPQQKFQKLKTQQIQCWWSFLDHHMGSLFHFSIQQQNCPTTNDWNSINGMPTPQSNIFNHQHMVCRGSDYGVVLFLWGSTFPLGSEFDVEESYPLIWKLFLIFLCVSFRTVETSTMMLCTQYTL